MASRSRIFAFLAACISVGAVAAAAPASAQEIPAHCLKRDLRKVCAVPESVFRELTAEQRQIAMDYARQNGIRWRIVRGR